MASAKEIVQELVNKELHRVTETKLRVAMAKDAALAAIARWERETGGDTKTDEGKAAFHEFTQYQFANVQEQFQQVNDRHSALTTAKNFVDNAS